MVAYNGPGDRLDAHGLDANAHGGIFASKSGPTPDVAAPQIVTPPGALFFNSALAVWYTANAATFLRFHNPFRQTFRWVNLYVGAQSGNIQVGVSSLARVGAVVNATKVMDSGVIACPAGNAATRVDCGSTTLGPGDYALWLWCDNTTASFLHGLSSGLTATRLLFSSTQAGGISSSVLTLSATTRFVAGLTLETDA